MTSTLDLTSIDEGDDAAAVLERARAAKQVEDDGAREVLRAAARWASMHSRESLVGPADSWHQSCLPLGGEGCPEVAELAIVEFAASLGRSTESGRRYLSHAVEGYYRLPRCWAQMDAGRLQAWRLCSVAERTITLSPEAAAFVDAHVAHVAHKIGPAQLGRLIDGVSGPITAEQVRLWCGNPDTRVTVRPVLDLAEHIHVDSYQASARLRAQADLRDRTCPFPYCNRPAGRCDHDHRVAHADDGPTCSCNITPCCRGHHRAKTTGGWSYITVEPGVYLWRSPLGYQFLRDHHGTVDVTPDAERLRLARTFLAHFGEQPGSPDAKP